MNTLKQQGLRLARHESSYFMGRYNKYGRYQYDVKYYGYESECEVDHITSCFLGEHVKLKNGRYGFELLSDLLKRDIESRLDGMSGGWLVIDTELTARELTRLDKYVENRLKLIPKMLTQLRGQ